MSGLRFPTIDEQRGFWRWFWQNHPETNLRGRDGLVAKVVLAWLRSLPLERPRILDLGCGMGWHTEKFAELGPATGIDLSAEAIAMAQARCPHVTFIAGDVYHTQLPPAHFDVVVSQEVFAHVEDQPRFLERAAEALRPGGYIVLTTANKFVMDRLGTVRFVPLGSAHIEQYVTVRGLKRLLRPHFDVLRVTTHLPVGDGGILRVINSYKLNAMVSVLIPHPQLDALKGWAGLGYSIIALARRRA
jgi:2-polyprenyl-3-methyl-5-hydroxy-6-metoxy-1,4-benzoquinol methylase